MKRYFCIIALLVFSMICLSSCSYDITEEVRATLFPGCEYEGTISIDQTESKVKLSLSENDSCSLLFTEGQMEGIEYFFSENRQENSLKDLSYPLSRPTKYILIRDCIAYLKNQSYDLQGKRGGVFSFEFIEGSVEIRLSWDDSLKAPKEISCKTSDTQMTFKFYRN